MPTKKRLGRPRKEERPGCVTISMRNVKREALDILHAQARRKKLTVGEMLSELVLNSPK